MAQESPATGPEAYPYDPDAKLESLSGLDRLRGIADRELAASLFMLFRLAERNTAAARTADESRARVHAQGIADIANLRKLAARALKGEFGAKVKELAQCLLTDENGAETIDERSLREFAIALQELRRISG